MSKTRKSNKFIRKTKTKKSINQKRSIQLIKNI